MYKLGLEKADEPEVKLLTFVGSWIKQGSSNKASTSALLTTVKPLTVRSQQTVENSLKGMETPDHFTCLLRDLHAGQEATVRIRHGTTDCFKMGKEYDKAIYCNPEYLTSCEMLG